MPSTEKITKVAVVGALEEEVAHIASALENVTHDHSASLDVSLSLIHI